MDESLGSAVSLGARWTAQRIALLGVTLLALLLVWGLPPLYLLPAVVACLTAAAVLRYPIVGLCLLAFCVPWGSVLTVTVGSFPVTPTEPLAALLVFVWLTSAVECRRNPLAGAPWVPWLAVFLVAIGISALVAIDVRASEREIVKWLEVALVYLAGSWFIQSRHHVDAVVPALVLGGISQAALGYFQSFLSLGPEAFATQHVFLRAYGTFDQPNPYAGYLNLVLPLALAMTLVGPRGPRRGWYGAAWLVMLGALLASESRGALLAGVAATAVMLASRYRAALTAFCLAMLTGLVGTLAAAYNALPPGPVDRVLAAVGLANVSFENVNDANFSAVERAAHWLAGVRMFEAHPLLGVGIGNYGAAYPAYHPRGWYASLEHAHNYYINIAAEAGVPGLTAYLLLAASALWYSYAALRSAYEPVMCAAALGVIGALVATGVHNIFDVLFVHGLTTLLALLMALLSPGAAPRQSDGAMGL